MIGVAKPLSLFVETHGTVQGSLTADDMMSVQQCSECDGRGEQNGATCTADSAACNSCKGEGKTFMTKSEREQGNLEITSGLVPPSHVTLMHLAQ